MPAIIRKIMGCMLLGVLLTACSGQKLKKYDWVLATASPSNTVTGIFAETFAEKISEISGGEMKVKVYHNSLLGGDTELIESCQYGDIPFVIQNTAPEVSYMPRLCLFDLPCAFSGLDQLHKVLDSPGFLTRVNGIYKEGGFHLLAMSDQNFREMTTNRAISSMNDFKGIKIRTMENSYHMSFWSAIGASPTPMAFAELYVGLEQHTVDAQENPYEVICSNGFYEVQDYVIKTDHLPHLLALVVNDDFYQGLSPKEREVVDAAAAQASSYAREQADARTSDRIHEIESNGSRILTISDDLRKAMRQASQPIYDRIREIVADDDLFNAYCTEQ